tara:strand:- start:358 stop:924 length:567 start_codon:yes stop_codon:yes gene_type:complete
MKINKKTLEALIEQEIRSLIQEGFMSSLVRGMTRGGKRSNFLTDFLSSTLVPQVAKDAYKSAKDLEKALEGMKNNQKFLSVAREKDSEGQPALPNSQSMLKTIRSEKLISINMLHRAAQAIAKDIEILSQQLGQDAPDLSGDQQADVPSGGQDAEASADAEDDSTVNESVDMLKERVKAKLKKLKSIS